MKDKSIDEISIQRNYYKKTADQYEKIHNANEMDEHFFALACLVGLINYHQIKSSCKSVHIMNRLDADINLYRTAQHIALLGIK